MIGVPYNPDVTIFLLSQSLNASQFNPNVPDTGNLTTHNLLFDTASQTLIWVNTKTNLIVQETSAGSGGTIGGGGTLNYISKYTPDGLNIGNSLLYDNGTSVGLGTNTPNASAIFELSSSTQGFATPRMTTLQRDAIATPIIGLLVYNTSTSFFNYWDGSTWIQMDTSTGGDVSGSGTTNYATMWTDGPNSVIGNGTWYFSGNDYLPVTTGANIGDDTHRIGTIFMASVFDYANNLTFYNGTTNTMTIQTDGYVNVGLGNITLGTYIGVPSISALFMNVTPTTNNYMLAGTTGGGTILNGASDVNYSVNNTSKMIMNSVYSQHYTPFGVGSIAPSGSQQFIVNGESYLKGISSNSSDYALKVDNSASSPLLYVRNDGNVGIGTANPLSILYVNSSVQNETVTLNNDDITGSSYFGLAQSGGVKGGIILLNSNHPFIPKTVIVRNLWDNGGIRINGGSGDTNMMFFDTSTFNVGINTQSPTSKLHVQGTDSTASNYALKVDNSASSPLFYARNDGYITTMAYNDTVSFLIGNKFSGDNTLKVQSDSSGRGFVVTENSNIVSGNGIQVLVTNSGTKIIRSLSNVSGATVSHLGIESTGTSIGSPYFLSSAMLHIQGIDSTSSNFALKVDNSAGNSLLYIRNDGLFTAPLLPTSNAGLSTGDMYIDTAANILANGDKVVGWKV